MPVLRASPAFWHTFNNARFFAFINARHIDSPLLRRVVSSPALPGRVLGWGTKADGRRVSPQRPPWPTRQDQADG